MVCGGKAEAVDQVLEQYSKLENFSKRRCSIAVAVTPTQGHHLFQFQMIRAISDVRRVNTETNTKLERADVTTISEEIR